jgi:hypothetical protein
MGMSLVTFLLIFKHLSLLRTVVARFYRRKKKRNIHPISTHAYMVFNQSSPHNSSIE